MAEKESMRVRHKTVPFRDLRIAGLVCENTMVDSPIFYIEKEVN